VRQFKPDPYSEIDGECDYGDDDRVKPHSSPEWSGDRSPGETQPVGTLYGLPAMSGTYRCVLTHCSKRHHYSITSSARASKMGGTSKPSCLAVLRLMSQSVWLANRQSFRLRQGKSESAGYESSLMGCGRSRASSMTKMRWWVIRAARQRMRHRRGRDRHP
jgi:hypothetical protein